MFSKFISWSAMLFLGLALLSWSALPSEAAKGGGGGGGGGRGGGGGSRGFSSARGTSGTWGHSSGWHNNNNNHSHNHNHHNQGFGFGFWPGFGWGYYYPDYGYSTEPIYRSSFYPTEEAESEPLGEPATITLKVPADAEVWFNNIKTKQTGKDRLFVSPPLIPGYSYGYQIRVSWSVDGKTVSQTRDISVRPGQNVTEEIRGPAPGQP
jgi:uncharacterized protein (TIGR03000 family)